MASDGKWYPPELWTGPPNTGPPMAGPGTTGGVEASAGEPGQAQSYPGSAPSYPGSAPSYPGSAQSYPSQAPVPTGSPYPAAGYPPQGYSQQGQYQPYGQYPQYGTGVKKTNGLAIASLVCGCAGFLFFVPAILAIVFGFIARAQIRQSAGTQGGDGLALAGILVGFAWIALFIIVIIVTAASNNTNTGVVGLLGVIG